MTKANSKQVEVEMKEASFSYWKEVFLDLLQTTPTKLLLLCP